MSDNPRFPINRSAENEPVYASTGQPVGDSVTDDTAAIQAMQYREDKSSLTMSDAAQARDWWTEAANHGIVGLEPLDQAEDDPYDMVWPHGGYDRELRAWHVNYDNSGRSRADWLALADEMVARWTAWRALVLAAPDGAFTADKGEA